MRDLELQSLKSLRSVPLVHIRISNLSFKETSVTVSREDLVSAVKGRVLGSEYSKECSSYKLLLAKTNRVLADDKTLEEEKIEDNDELILLRRRLQAGDSAGCQGKESSKYGARAPDLATIKKLTSKLGPESVKESTSGSSPPQSLDFNTELRRILVTLIDSSILLQSVNQDQAGPSGQDEAARFSLDQVALKQLTDMGFAEARAKKALLCNRMSAVLAMEWLLQHESDPDIDEPLGEGERRGRTARKRKEFVPNSRAVHKLKEMGFEEEEIVMALKATGNSQEAAINQNRGESKSWILKTFYTGNTLCEWLLGDRKAVAEDVDQGLDQSSPLYEAIMENPLVQLSLNNPRILVAFEDMLDNPTTSAYYINDPETGPVLLQISRIFQGFAR